MRICVEKEIKDSMETTGVIPIEQVQNIIILLRGQRVMLDADLAVLYGVKTKVLKRTGAGFLLTSCLSLRCKRLQT
jgi:hypothetical protein